MTLIQAVSVRTMFYQGVVFDPAVLHLAADVIRAICGRPADPKPQFASPGVPAAAMVFWRGAQFPRFKLMPITVVDFYPRKPA